MKKFKDFIYDYNDILLASLIIIVAGAIIFWKVTDIMAYPAFAKQQQESKVQQEVDITDLDLDPVDVDPNMNPGTDVIGEGNEVTPVTPPENQPANNPAPTGNTKFEIKEKQYLSTVAANLKAAGLIKDDKAFIKLVEDLKLDSKLQIGTFEIPAGSTDEQIAKIITRTN